MSDELRDAIKREVERAGWYDDKGDYTTVDLSADRILALVAAAMTSDAAVEAGASQMCGMWAHCLEEAPRVLTAALAAAGVTTEDQR